jgi:hypothetical protein
MSCLLSIVVILAGFIDENTIAALWFLWVLLWVSLWSTHLREVQKRANMGHQYIHRMSKVVRNIPDAIILLYSYNYSCHFDDHDSSR